MSEANHRESELVLGGQNPPPINAAILGGEAGKKRQLANELGLSDRLAYEVTQDCDIFSFENVVLTKCGRFVSRTQKKAFYYTEILSDDATLDMVYIPAGTFIMGSDNYYWEQPIHSVTLKSFYMAKYPTTQIQYQSVVGKNPSRFVRNDFPVEQVLWYDTQEFCEKLALLTQKTYKLPSESQWEYACCENRLEPNNVKGFGETINYAQREQTINVGTFPANAFGLYDMRGNVWEWCLDDYHYNYQDAPDDGSPWLDKNNNTQISKPLRGGYGSGDGSARMSRFPNRPHVAPVQENVGFRVVLSIEECI